MFQSKVSFAPAIIQDIYCKLEDLLGEKTGYEVFKTVTCMNRESLYEFASLLFVLQKTGENSLTSDEIDAILENLETELANEGY